MKKITTFLLIVLFISSSFLTINQEMSIDEKIVNQILKKTGKDLERQYHLNCDGSGASMMEEVKMLALSFTSTTPLSISDARKLILECVKDFCKNVNENKEVTPFLSNIPFTSKNIEVRITGHDKNNTAVSPPHIAYVASLKGNIFYYAREGNLKLIHKESFEEAESSLRN